MLYSTLIDWEIFKGEETWLVWIVHSKIIIIIIIVIIIIIIISSLFNVDVS